MLGKQRAKGAAVSALLVVFLLAMFAPVSAPMVLAGVPILGVAPVCAQQGNECSEEQEECDPDNPSGTNGESQDDEDDGCSWWQHLAGMAACAACAAKVAPACIACAVYGAACEGAV